MCATEKKSDALASWGLPGAPVPKSFAPASPLVGASCLLFGLCGLHGWHNGDLTSAMLALLVTVNSFTADYVNNVPNLVPGLTRSRICACDRACATAYSLWLVRVAVFQLGPMMLLTLVPLVIVLSYSRASKTREVWVLRHSFWHLFCVAECVAIMQAVYHSDVRGELRHQLSSREGVQRLAIGPVGAGLTLAIHGLRGAAADAERRAAAQRAHSA